MGRVCLHQNAFQESDHAPQIPAPARAAQVLRIGALILAVLWSNPARADQAHWRIWVEASFNRPAASASIPGAERSLISGGSWDGQQLHPFSADQWKALGLSWEAFAEQARPLGAEALDQLGLRYERDARKVIRYAELRSTAPVAAVAVLLPEFGLPFLETLGKDLLVAVPNRYQIFVFPKLSKAELERYSGLLREAYGATAYPVSREVFEWNGGNLRAVKGAAVP